MYIMKLTPTIKDYIWGGRRLIEDFGKKTDLACAAESWELSCHADGQSTAADGEYKGHTLAEYIEREGRQVLGTNCEKFAEFPVLIKLIDAARDLSIQVHPNDEYAQRVEGEYGKTEMWYIVDCVEGSKLYYGFKQPTSKAAFKQSIEDCTLEELLNSVTVHKGDVFFIEAGTIHAIGAGIIIAEIQQNSNTTYRVYDYGRLGADGKPRALHVEKALDVTATEPAAPYVSTTPVVNGTGFTRSRLADCKYFTVDKLDINGGVQLCADTSSFNSLLCVSGSGIIKSSCGEQAINKGDSFFIPAGFGSYSVSGMATVILTSV